MLLSTRYWLVGICSAVTLVILVVHHNTPSGDDLYKKTLLMIKHEEIEKLRKELQIKILKGENLCQTKTPWEIKHEELEKERKDLQIRNLKEIINMMFYDDPLNEKCESNSYLLRTKDSMECLAMNNIFFLETSGSSRLNARQACAVESAALHHPEWQVRVLFTPAEPLDLKDSFMEILALFSNVKLKKIELDSLMLGTPLWYWYKRARWKSSPYKVVHLSDAIRLCLLWKYGGIYLDMDVVVLHSLSDLHNSVAFDSGANVGNSFLAFDRGQSLLRVTLTDYVASYNPNDFASNGPLLLNRNFKKHCKPKPNNATDNLCHINVLPKVLVYPIDFDKCQEYFNPRNDTLGESVFKSSYIIHIWNNLSSAYKMYVGDNSWYEREMKIHCPKVYELVEQIGYA